MEYSPIFMTVTVAPCHGRWCTAVCKAVPMVAEGDVAFVHRLADAAGGGIRHHDHACAAGHVARPYPPAPVLVGVVAMPAEPNADW